MFQLKKKFEFTNLASSTLFSDLCSHRQSATRPGLPLEEEKTCQCLSLFRFNSNLMNEHTKICFQTLAIKNPSKNLRWLQTMLLDNNENGF